MNKKNLSNVSFMTLSMALFTVANALFASGDYIQGAGFVVGAAFLLIVREYFKVD